MLFGDLKSGIRGNQKLQIWKLTRTNDLQQVFDICTCDICPLKPRSHWIYISQIKTTPQQHCVLRSNTLSSSSRSEFSFIIVDWDTTWGPTETRNSKSLLHFKKACKIIFGPLCGNNASAPGRWLVISCCWHVLADNLERFMGWIKKLPLNSFVCIG